MIAQISGIVLLAIGFGFVIFWHELGHFLAAKSVGIRCEQFAVGFGQAIFSWRKGLGFHAGSTKAARDSAVADDRKKREAKIGRNADGELLHPVEESDDQIAAELGLGETEYRLNWIPLGGYVKMLGQDDLDPNAKSADPRAFNNKSVPARMVVVSAGVIMNVILAMIGFAVVFGFGFDAPPTVVGNFQQGSPAQKAGLHVGDRIVYVNDSFQHDFTKLAPNVMLAGDGAELRLTVQRPDGSFYNTTIQPQRESGGGVTKGLLVLGVSQPTELAGPIEAATGKEAEEEKSLVDDQLRLINPDERITAINGKAVAPIDSADQIRKDPTLRNRTFLAKQQNVAMLDDAIQNSHGQPVVLTLADAAGKTRTVSAEPSMQLPFDRSSSITFGGMTPRTMVSMITPKSPVHGVIMPGDIITAVATSATPPVSIENPSTEELRTTLNGAGQAGDKVTLTFLHDGQPITKSGLEMRKLEDGRYGVGVGLGLDDQHAIVGEVVKGSPAEMAGIKRGMTLTSLNGKPVASWFDVRDAMQAFTAGQPVQVGVKDSDKPLTIAGLTDDQIASIRSIRYQEELPLRTMSMPRQTSNPVQAAVWGVGETKDLLVQFYISLRRLVDGTVPATAMMGPVGIFTAGTGFAAKGTVWLLWFLCMISANLAVVNFLPIPIVDGGLFTFLIIEKIQGRPLSQRAQSIAQMVGLALIGFVFLFATWQDIARLF